MKRKVSPKEKKSKVSKTQQGSDSDAKDSVRTLYDKIYRDQWIKDAPKRSLWTFVSQDEKSLQVRRDLVLNSCLGRYWCCVNAARLNLEPITLAVRVPRVEKLRDLFVAAELLPDTEPVSFARDKELIKTAQEHRVLYTPVHRKYIQWFAQNPTLLGLHEFLGVPELTLKTRFELLKYPPAPCSATCILGTVGISYERAIYAFLTHQMQMRCCEIYLGPLYESSLMRQLSSLSVDKDFKQDMENLRSGMLVTRQLLRTIGLPETAVTEFVSKLVLLPAPEESEESLHYQKRVDAFCNQIWNETVADL